MPGGGTSLSEAGLKNGGIITASIVSQVLDEEPPSATHSASVLDGASAASSQAPQPALDEHLLTCVRVGYQGSKHRLYFCLSRDTVAELFVELLNSIRNIPTPPKVLMIQIGKKSGGD